MTYMKPELVELLSAAHIIQGSDGDGSQTKKTLRPEAAGDNSDTGSSTTAGAYEADE